MKFTEQRKTCRFRRVAALASVAALGLQFDTTAMAQSGGGYVITRSTIDGGGITYLSDGEQDGYRLGGTVGQHDASGPLTDVGGAYQLTGGFWHGIPRPPTSGNDVCFGGGSAGQPCGANVDCPGGFCGLKNRFISFVPGTGTNLGIRATLTALDSNSVANPSNYNGTTRWVGPPTLNVGDGVSGTFNAAPLQCTFHAQDWSALGMLHVFGAAVVPLSRYDVEMCSTSSGPCSAPLRIDTGKFGDVKEPYVTSQPSFTDIGAIVDKFQGKPAGPSKTRSKLREPVNLGEAVGFLEVSACVSAFQNKVYKNLFPTPPPTCP